MDYQKPKHPSLIVEMVNAYLMKGWDVQLNATGIIAERLLNQGVDIFIIDTPQRIQFFNAHFRMILTFGDVQMVEDDEETEEDAEACDDEEDTSQSGSPTSSGTSGSSKSEHSYSKIRTKKKMDRSSTRMIDHALFIREGPITQKESERVAVLGKGKEVQVSTERIKPAKEPFFIG